MFGGCSEPTAVETYLQDILHHISFTTLHFIIFHDVITSNEDLKKYRVPEIQSLQNSEVHFHTDHCGDRRKCLQSQWRVVGSLPQKKHSENVNLTVGPEILLLILSQFSLIKKMRKTWQSKRTEKQKERDFFFKFHRWWQSHFREEPLAATFSNRGTSFSW